MMHRVSTLLAGYVGAGADAESGADARRASTLAPYGHTRHRYATEVTD